MSDAPLLSLRGVSKSYGPTRALDGVDLELQPGATGLLGPNGSGKTTLVRVLLGLVRPDEGEASVFGLSVARDGKRIRRRVGYVPEGDSYIEGATSVQLLTFAGTLAGLGHREGVRRAHEVLEAVGTGESRYRQVETLSQGMRVRVKIAQALVHGPELLILDEPTSGLDPAARDEVLTLVRDIIAQAGVSVLLCSHVLEDVERLCARVAFIHQGRVVAHDRIETLCADGEHAGLVVRFEGDRERLAAALREEGLTARPLGPDQLDVAGAADALPVYRAARACGARIRGVEPGRASLEDLFLRFVQDAPAAPAAGAPAPAGPPATGPAAGGS